MMEVNQKQKIIEFVESEFSIQNLDDMANIFFKIAEAIGHPLKNINLELTKSWGEQFEEKRKNKVDNPAYNYIEEKLGLK
jgi:hypothetical protein